MSKSNLPAPSTLPPVKLKPGQSLQRITYTCGCEAIGIAPMAPDCPTHGASTPSAKPKAIHVAVVLDESGSMESCRDKTIEGYNEYLGGLRQSGLPYLVTLTKFDAHPKEPTCRVAYQSQAILSAPNLSPDNYAPRGSTPLYDAIGQTIRAVEQCVNGDPVLILIITDGEENASKEFTKETVKALIQLKEQGGNWTFVYLGANQNAWAVGQQFGMQRGNVASYTSAAMPAVMKNLGHATRGYGAQAMCSVGAYNSASFFDDAGIKDVDSDPAAAALGSKGGKARMASLSKEERSKLAQQAANLRWKTS